MNRIIFFSLLFSFFSYCVCAQDKLSRKEKRKLVNQADLAFDSEDYARSWPLYKKILSVDKNNETAALNAAVSSSRLNYSTDSVLFLRDALSSSSLIDSKFYLAVILHQQKKFDEALALLEKYKKYNSAKRTISTEDVNYLANTIKNAKQMIANPKKAVIKNIGTNINSPYADYVPVIVPDESAMYFTSKRPGTSQQKNADNNYFEDVYVSYRVNGSWQQAQLLPAPVNSETNDGCVAVSPDGQNLIIYRTAANVTSGDLYTTRIGKNNSWEPLVVMPKEINSEFIETSACFSNDTTDIYFSSDRPGGFGGKDLYRIRRLPNGNWSLPYNLGSSINTKYHEDAPFLHPDGVTLYFSSKGHNTMGEYDVFKCAVNKEKNEYSDVENLGYPLNDVGNDIFFILSVDGQRGYYSSVKAETDGGMDIYEIDTRFEENDLTVVHGKVTLDGIGGRARIAVIDAVNGVLQGSYLSNPDSGNFILVLNPLKSYNVDIESENYVTQSIKMEPIVNTKGEKTLNFNLKKKETQ